MQSTHRHQWIALGTFLIISLSMGLMYGIKNAHNAKKATSSTLALPPLPKPPIPTVFTQAPPIHYTSGLADLSASSLLASVRLLVESQSVELLVEQLHGISLKAAHDFLQELISKPRSMDSDEVIQVAYGLLMYFVRDKELLNQMYQVFDLINTAPELKDHPPLLVIAAHSSYPHIIQRILPWAKARHTIDQILHDGLIFVATTLDLHMLKTMETYGVDITPELATLMLWHALQSPVQKSGQDDEENELFQKNRHDFFEFLINKKANVNYDRDGYTMLMKAAHNNDAPTIQQLIQAGAEVDRIVRDDIGSALQIAMLRDAIDAELMLRRYNARE